MQQSPNNYNFQQQPQNPNAVQQQPIPNNQQQPNPQKNLNPANMFHVQYNGTTFLVDPSALYESSNAFKELIQPYIQNIDQLREMHLDIFNVQFTKRNINNFLRLCQKLPTDVQNSEMEEICEIAKMFKADSIYNTGLAFIQGNLDPNFSVPDNKYDGSDGKTYLIVEGDSSPINHDPNLPDDYFEDASNKSYQGNYYKINDDDGAQDAGNQQNNNANAPNQQENNNLPPSQPENNNVPQNPPNNNESQQNNDGFDLNDHSKLHDPVFGLDQATQNQQNSENSSEKAQNPSSKPSGLASAEDKSTELNNEKSPSVIYYLRVENHTFKCPVFKFVKDNQIIYTAKQKYEEIYIAEGGDIHIRNKENHVGHITQNDITKTNKVQLQATDFLIKYVNSGAPEHFSLEVSFPLNDGVVNWEPKPPRYDPTTEKYYLNFHGEHHHTPVLSSKNIVLQDKDGKSTCIIRKMDRNVYEIECSPVVDSLIAFSVGLSDIIGPYLDPYANFDYFD